MLRRSHKKSRRGCLECKRRHIKCDETRPRCLNCTTVERSCSFPASATTGTSPASAPSRASTPSVSGPPEPAAPAENPVTPFLPTEDLTPDIDMVHMELMYHFINSHDLIQPLLALDGVREILMRQALQAPYLMHQILALSARHLSHERPHSQAFYHNVAIHLQTKALRLFRSLPADHFSVSVANRVQGFLFPGMLGFHVLCDFLSHREGDFSTMLARFVGCLHLHRGVYQIMEGQSWEELGLTELAPLLQAGERWFMATGEGHECDDIRARIEAAGLGGEELEGARKAIDLIQSSLDESHPTPVSKTHVVMGWGVMVSNAFVAMIAAARPEAVVILAYYFVTLHHFREVWVVGDAGEYFFNAAAEYLGPNWAAWLERPRQLLSSRPRHTFSISKPEVGDAARIAAVQCDAMGSNKLLMRQFPSLASIAAFERFLEQDAATKLAESDPGILVAKVADTGQIAAFVKWSSPSQPEPVKLENSGVQDIPGCDRALLEEYVVLAEAAKKRSFGDEPCYQVSFVCVDQGFWGHRAGSLLMTEVMAKAAVDKLPIYLESTEDARGMYRRLGFEEVDQFQISIPSPPSFAAPFEWYREWCMVWRPMSCSSSGSE
ncbi:sterol uptake control protein 2 [Podospora conica]|nr:sterol uptake control protein 2 [Schizothecium conicum]